MTLLVHHDHSRDDGGDCDVLVRVPARLPRELELVTRLPGRARRPPHRDPNPPESPSGLWTAPNLRPNAGTIMAVPDAADARLPESLERLLRRAVGTPQKPITAHGDSHNAHCRATTPAGTAVFVTIFTEQDYWRRAINAAPVVEPLLRTPHLLDHGQLDDGHWWATYEWLDLAPFRPDPDSVAQLGRMVGRLHAATAGATAGFEAHDLHVEIEARIAALAGLDPAAADRARALWQRRDRVEFGGPVGVVHGDLHWRNVGMLDDQVILFDLENTRAAPPIVDFGKLVDLDELAEPACRAALFAGYETYAAPVWPWPEAMRMVRLWTTCGVLVYALARGLTEFAAHGYRRLAGLETEAG